VSAREELLERCQNWLQSNGFGSHSLREIAAGVGTSHRMLIYHFGSLEGLLAGVVGRVEATQREVLAQLSDSSDPAEASRVFWRHLADPQLAPAERLFFEIYADALHERPWTAGFRESVIAAWDEPVTAMFEQLGFDPDEAQERARLSVAATRGLLLDLLLTGDTDRLTASADLFAGLILQPKTRPASAARTSKSNR
jgi:AcrR family transcriptional regulator